MALSITNLIFTLGTKLGSPGRRKIRKLICLVDGVPKGHKALS